MNGNRQALKDELRRLRDRVDEVERLLAEGAEGVPQGAPTALPEEPLAVAAPALRDSFERAQQLVGQYFQRKEEDPLHGRFSISGERYILVRAASLSTEFFDLVRSLYRDRGEEEAGPWPSVSCLTSRTPWERPMRPDSRNAWECAIPWRASPPGPSTSPGLDGLGW